MAFKKTNKSTMGEVFDEMVPSAVLPAVKENKNFIINENGKTVYVGMLLDVAKIGGITEKSKNDKNIGGAVESIRNGKIQAFITKQLIEDNQLLFIPTSITLDRLGDYGTFRNVSGYEFVKLNDNLEIIEHTEVFESYDTFRTICDGKVAITDFVKPADKDVIIAGSADDPTVSKTQQAVNKIKEAANTVKDKVAPVVDKVAPVVNKAAEAVKEKISDATGIKDMQEKPAETVQEQSEEPAVQAAPAEKAKPTANAQPEAKPEQKPAEPSEDDAPVVHTETQVLSTVKRVFNSDNLDIEITTDPFDQMFTVNNQLITFELDERDTYVNERLNHMAADANRNLKKLRADNMGQLRQKYINLLTYQVQDIEKQYDIENPSTKYGKMKHDIEASKAQQLANIEQEIEKKQADQKASFEKSLQEYCDEAAARARQEYKSKHEPFFNKMLGNIEGMVRRDIEQNYEAAMHNMYNARRTEALTTLDKHISGVIAVLSDDYRKMLDEENKLYMSHRNAMIEYSKELHQEDAKRLAVEEERNRITNEVNDARAEAAAQIALIKQEYETAQSALESRSSATIMKAENEAQLMKDQLAARTSDFEKEKLRMQKQLDDAIERADKAQDIVKADYEHRLIQAQDDRDSWKQTLDAYQDQHRHNSRLAAVLVIAITIAAIAGGFVAGGVYWNRIVSGELSSNNSPAEIKVIEPDATQTTVIPSEEDIETTTSDTSDDDNTSETPATTAVPETTTQTGDATTRANTTQTSVTTTIANNGTETPQTNETTTRR